MSSRMTSDAIEHMKNSNEEIQFGGPIQINGNIVVTGSLTAVDAAAVGSGTLGKPVLVLSGSGGNYISSSTGIQMTIAMTGSLEMANPASATLVSMFPDAQTGSLYMVGSGSETWLAFKGIAGIWRTITASIAA